jgi:hypothetical protein
MRGENDSIESESVGKALDEDVKYYGKKSIGMLV